MCEGLGLRAKACPAVLTTDDVTAGLRLNLRRKRSSSMRTLRAMLRCSRSDSDSHAAEAMIRTWRPSSDRLMPSMPLTARTRRKRLLRLTNLAVWEPRRAQNTCPASSRFSPSPMPDCPPPRPKTP